MKRNLQAFGLVVATVFAMSALGTSTAPASEFHSAGAPATISGSQVTGSEQVLTTDAGTVRCSTATLKGAMNSTTMNELELTPTYESCEAFFFVNVPVHINGCFFWLGAAGTSQIVCQSGKVIEITAPGCTTKIGPQHFGTGVSYLISGSHLVSIINISGVHYYECGDTTSNGTLTGKFTKSGSKGAIWFTK